MLLHCREGRVEGFGESSAAWMEGSWPRPMGGGRLDVHVGQRTPGSETQWQKYSGRDFDGSTSTGEGFFYVETNKNKFETTGVSGKRPRSRLATGQGPPSPGSELFSCHLPRSAQHALSQAHAWQPSSPR